MRYEARPCGTSARATTAGASGEFGILDQRVQAGPPSEREESPRNRGVNGWRLCGNDTPTKTENVKATGNVSMKATASVKAIGIASVKAIANARGIVAGSAWKNTDVEKRNSASSSKRATSQRRTPRGG